MRTITWCRIKISAIIKIAHADIVLEIGRHCLEAYPATPRTKIRSLGKLCCIFADDIAFLLWWSDGSNKLCPMRTGLESQARGIGIEFGTIRFKRFAHKMRQVLGTASPSSFRLTSHSFDDSQPHNK